MADALVKMGINLPHTEELMFFDTPSVELCNNLVFDFRRTITRKIVSVMATV